MYIKDYYINFDKEFAAYKADTINVTNISSEDFDNNLSSHKKDFKKLLRRDKLIDIFKILFIVSLFAVCIIAMIGL